MIKKIQNYCDSLKTRFEEIPKERKLVLERIAQYIAKKKVRNEPVNLIYICTHNSRRSHFGQVWAHVSAIYYGVPEVYVFSGGTEVTAFNKNAINALLRIGFEVKPINSDKNPVYLVHFDEFQNPIECFSKVYNDPKNPGKDFAAIMTCSEAEENCPFIPGVDLRISTSYEDPKAFDNTEIQDAKYDERCRQIALETLYVFSLIK